MPDPWFTLLNHRRSHGYLPDLHAPSTLNEKIAARKLYDRRPILAQFADKLEVRDYVAARLPAAYLPRLYHVTTSPETIPFDRLPQRFVIKPSHGSGWVRLVPDKDDIDHAAIIAECRRWLAKNYYHASREWAYKHLTPRILIEEYIEGERGAAPLDYKCFTFMGGWK